MKTFKTLTDAEKKMLREDTPEAYRHAAENPDVEFSSLPRVAVKWYFQKLKNPTYAKLSEMALGETVIYGI